MKKTICIILTVICLLAVSGCSNEGKYSIKICGYSDSVLEADHKLEYKKWSEDVFVDSKVEQNVEITVLGAELEATYKDSEVNFYEYYPTHRYKDSENNFFELSPNKKICSYFWGTSDNSQNNGTLLTESECVDIARNFVNDLTDTQDYELSVEFDEDDSLYHVTFTKYVGELKTADQASVLVEASGHLYSFNSTLLGRISTDPDIEFDMDAVNEQVRSKLDTVYKDAIEVYDSVKYENIDYVLTMTSDSDYALVCSVDVRCINSNGEYDEIISERIRFIIE